jgi:hypothetical protein
MRASTTNARRPARLTKPLLPWIRAAFPDHILTTADRPRHVAHRQGSPKRVLETRISEQLFIGNSVRHAGVRCAYGS